MTSKKQSKKLTFRKSDTLLVTYQNAIQEYLKDLELQECWAEDREELLDILVEDGANMKIKF
jgi:hypothetical protein